MQNSDMSIFCIFDINIQNVSINMQTNMQNIGYDDYKYFSMQNNMQNIARNMQKICRICLKICKLICGILHIF